MHGRHSGRVKKFAVSGCRFCGEGQLFRVRRRNLDHGLSWVGLYPYRCDVCQKRSYRFQQRRPRAQAPGEPNAQSAASGITVLVDLLQRMATANSKEQRRPD